MKLWQEEKDLLIENIKTASKINKSIYTNLDTLMKFLNNIPEVYKNANIENKQRLLRLIVESAT